MSVWKNKICRNLLCAALTAALLFGSTAFPAFGTDTDEQIDALRQKSEELQAQIDAAEQEIEAIRSDVNKKQEYADELSGNTFRGHKVE